MKRNITLLGDYWWKYIIGKHEFFTSIRSRLHKINRITEVIFQAEDLCIRQDGKEINLSNDDLQDIINIYIGRMKQNKKLNREVNKIKENNPDMKAWDAMRIAEKNLNM